MLQIDNQSLIKSYEIGLVTRDDNWISILHEIALKEDGEAMLVKSVNHVITINKKNGAYIIYDPNYEQVFKKFNSEKELLDELHNVFHIEGFLGLTLQIVRHPSQENNTRSFPDASKLYQQHMAPKIISRSGWISIDNMELARGLNNFEMIKSIYTQEINKQRSFNAAGYAISCNRPQMLQFILEQISDKDKIDFIGLFQASCSYGTLDTFNELLKNERAKNLFLKQITKEKCFCDFMMGAVQSNDIDLLDKIITFYQINDEPESCSDKKIVETLFNNHRLSLDEPLHTNMLIAPSGDIIRNAIMRNATNCLTFLLKKITVSDYNLTEKQMLTYLSQAIKTNHPHMVNLLIDEIKATIPEEIQKKLFQSIKMNIKSVEQTDISILRQLKSCGVPFSTMALAVIDIKESRPIRVLLPIGIMLNKFTDFIKEQIISSIEQMQKFKNEIIQTKTHNSSSTHTESNNSINKN